MCGAIAFLLFLEPPSLEIPQDAPEYKNELEQRRSWDAMDFARQYGLRLVGVSFMIVRAV